MSASAAGPRLVVSIHDVAPVYAEDLRYLLEACDAAGARPRVLKVIPDEGGRHDLGAYPDFAALLRAEAQAGSEIVLHGYTHEVARPIAGWSAASLRARLFAPQAAEFVTLDGAEMAERLAAGRRILHDAGLDVQGFCAPGWLASGALPGRLRECGFRYAVTMAWVQDVVTGRRIFTPWQGYMGAGSGQERMIRLGSWGCMRLASRARAIKLFLHPQGARTSADCARVLENLSQLVRQHTCVTFRDLLDRYPESMDETAGPR
jgi:hypothetical protein